ncbi:hypothetical protein NQ314_014466 [Rhamnusium bicolor]|uniref:Elongator complex protein 2 n=1 Tax=Rhamnusium bicolor TaxID=1586634 RepID=A0AAV8X1S8_9CUCU|nr:hypothetical protein NQ314_014466 [Rhamnusium bicolor]
MKFENCYISSNCNQTPGVVDWGKNNIICYGSCNSIMIYDPNIGGGGKVTHTLAEHSKRVNSVKWLAGKDNSYETELISGSTDSLVIVWTLKGNCYEPSILRGHESNVNIVDGLYKESEKNNTIIVSASMDCTVKIWSRLNPIDEFNLVQTIKFGYSIAVGLKMSYIPNIKELILACALDNSKIQMYVEDEDVDNKLEFQSSVQLVGHEDWVRGMHFTIDDQDLLLASCSQDTFIRLWRITKKAVIDGNLDQFDNDRNQIRVKGEVYDIYLESVLTGHEGWVYSVNWNPKSLQLLSASIDKSMIIWEYDNSSGLWLEKIRVGEIGGNTLGFYGGSFGPDGNQILAHSYHGAFHIWTNCEKLGSWAPSVTITWHEIARPQVHGYDISCLAVISRYKFASGAEEKIIRAFQAPKNFVENFKRICRINQDEEGDIIEHTQQLGPKGASVPSLGLSNKAVYTDDNIDQATSVDKRNPYPEESHFTATDMIEPPTEETLLQNTLWPEIQKLYGHGYEVYSLAASPDGKYLASACKSTKPEHSAVLLWDTSNWKQIQKLISHTLTVVQLQFSPDSKNLLSVSRDRRWSLFSRNEQDQFELVATTNKSTGIHSRIIWTCAWSHNSKYFATGSRDGKIVVWTINKGKEKTNVLGECEAASEPLEFSNESVTAVAFAPGFISGSYLIAVGLESGIIHLYRWSLHKWKAVFVFSKGIAHNLTVRRLCFRPVFGMAGYKECDENVLQLASCSSDYSVRIYNIFVNTVS